MAWDFETDPAFQEELDWIESFVSNEIEPIDHVIGHPLDMQDPVRNKLIKPLQSQVKERNLWAFHLGPDLGGPGLGQLKLALMNESLGRSRSAPVVFGCHAPDSGNAEILSHYGTPDQKARYLEPLLANEITSCFAITEPQGGADPKVFEARAEPIDGKWRISGRKWFATNARFASFVITMAVTDPDADNPYKRMSMFIVPIDTPGVEFIRNMSVVNEPGPPSHAYLGFNDVVVPDENMLGPRGAAFEVAQVRLGGGRVHHAMRTLAQCRHAFDMMCERALSRFTQGEQLAKKQMVQEKIADSWLQLEQFRLFLLQTAWRIDKYNDYKKVRKDIAAVK
ncbi:MAG: acyl-CoA dehydrogenase family protein, partial [Pseudomonadota bacterium]